MSNIFSKIASGTAKVFHALIGGLQKADGVIDKDEPIVEKLLEEGATVAATIPGVGPQAAELLDAGVTVIAQVKDAVDGTNAAAQALQAQFQAQIAAGSKFSVLVIEADAKAAIVALIAQYEAEFSAAKQAVASADAAKAAKSAAAK